MTSTAVPLSRIFGWTLKNKTNETNSKMLKLIPRKTHLLCWDQTGIKAELGGIWIWAAFLLPKLWRCLFVSSFKLQSKGRKVCCYRSPMAGSCCSDLTGLDGKPVLHSTLYFNFRKTIRSLGYHFPWQKSFLGLVSIPLREDTEFSWNKTGLPLKWPRDRGRAVFISAICLSLVFTQVIWV